jgi:hypothetical protein
MLNIILSKLEDLISAILQDSNALTEPVVASIRNLVHEVCSYSLHIPKLVANRRLIA